MRRERNCRGKYSTERGARYELGDGVAFDECPTSYVPARHWAAIDLFWLCHRRVAGTRSWSLATVGLPEAGGIYDQDHWMMWAFSVLSSQFALLQQEAAVAAQEAADLAKLHQRTIQA